MLLAKPIYRVLSHPDLIKKCLHGRTQNPNESFNDMIWLRTPKNAFFDYNTLKMVVYDAVLSFNMRNLGTAKVLHQLNIQTVRTS
jgi:hypothetical protein